MLTPLQLVAGIWLATLPALGGASAPSSPPGILADGSRTYRSDERAASLLALDDEEFLQVVQADPAALGSLSIGGPGSGRLFNGVKFPEGERWVIAPTAEAWATTETIEAIQTAIDTVHQLFPETPPIYLGDMSGRDGGRLKRHASHQCGRDADLGFYFKDGAAATLVAGTAKNLDLPRNWALVRALVARTDVESILLDTRIQRVLYRYAASIAEDQAWLDRIFGFVRGSRDAVIKHVAGHRNHYHVRFYNPLAQELGRRAHPVLVDMQLVDPPVRTVRHLVRAGETIGRLAARYGTTVDAIMRANGLRTERLRARRSYRIPVRAAFSPPTPFVLRPRLLPPQTPELMAGVEWPTPESLYPDAGQQER